MWRRLPWILLVLLAASLALAGCGGSKTYSADRYDVSATVQTDGTLDVQETVAFRFVGGPFTYVFRDVPTRHTDGITGIRATLDGEVLAPGTGPQQIEITNKGDSVEVRWHFAPVSDATHTFGLSYRVLGVVRPAADADVLAWGALPVKHDYEIGASTITIRWPEQARPLAAPRLLAGQGSIQQSAGQATITAQNIRDDDELTFEQRFAPGSLVTQAPAWLVRQQAANRAAPPYVAAAVLILLAGSAWYILAGRSNGRQAQPAGVAAGGQTAPPTARRPAIAGALAAGGQESWALALGALFDMAQRGVLNIEQTGESRWADRAKNYTLRLLRPDGWLARHEQGLLDLIFGEQAHTAGATVTLAEVHKQVGKRWKAFKEPLRDELRTEGLVDPAREAQRGRLLASGVLLLVLAVVILIVMLIVYLPRDFWPPLLLPAALVAVSIVGLIVAAVYPIVSVDAASEAGQWRGFRRYLQQVARGRAALAQPGQYQTYLPLAAALGLAEPWAKAMAREQAQAIPAWFHALSGSTADLSGAFVVMVAAHSSAGSSGSGAAAGGAAGGGASGAG